jgi:predicted HicB family RNase H-like nuclease
MTDNTMKYKGYLGSIEYDDRDKILHGRVLGNQDIVSFEGESVARLEEDFRAAVDDYLDACRDMGKEPEKPFSGKFTIRVSSGLHAEIALKAKDSGKSLNSWVMDVLAQATRQ